MSNKGVCLKILSVKPEGCFLDCSNDVWEPLVYPNSEELNPCCDFRSYKITARYVFHKTAPSWRGHLWITHLDFHPSWAVQPHKVHHWRTEEEKLPSFIASPYNKRCIQTSVASSTPTAPLYSHEERRSLATSLLASVLLVGTVQLRTQGAHLAPFIHVL